VVEHYLHTADDSKRNAPEIDVFSQNLTTPSTNSPNKAPNIPRFRRVERWLHRHIRSGELWFVGRRGGRVVWRRLRTPDLHSARATVAMFNSCTNGNSAMFLVVDGKEQPISDDSPAQRNEPLPRIREVMVPAETPTSTSKLATVPHSTGAVPTLDELLVRWRSAKAGLKPSTEQKLDCHLKMLRRYVKTDLTCDRV
jgi:hypothetical protein